jgi:hypothetical protein
MLLNRAFRYAFRNFSTLFLLVAMITVPLQMGYAIAFRSVIAVNDLQPYIERFPPHREVRGVGREQLAQARLTYWSLTALEIAMLPLLVGAARRVIEVDSQGRLPGVADAWRHAFRRTGSKPWPPSKEAGVAFVVAGLVTVAVAVLCRLIGSLLIEALGTSVAFAGVGVVEGVSRAVAAPFFLTPWAVARREAAKGGHTAAPSLY